MELTIDMIRTCKLAALSCRDCVSQLSLVNPLPYEHQQKFQQCEDICFAFLQAASIGSLYLQDLIFLCTGLCEECAELAEEKSEEVYKEASVHCRDFSSMLINLIQLENSRLTI